MEIYPALRLFRLPEGGNGGTTSRWRIGALDQAWSASGAVLTNITDRVLTGTYYILTVSDNQGRVCLVAKDFINMILPGETLNFSPGLLRLPKTVVPSQVDLLIVPGEFGEYALAYNPLSTTQPLLDLEGESPFVRVNVLNNLNAGISTVLVSVVIKDQQGKIVGGGQILTDRVQRLLLSDCPPPSWATPKHLPYTHHHFAGVGNNRAVNKGEHELFQAKTRIAPFYSHL